MVDKVLVFEASKNSCKYKQIRKKIIEYFGL